jgi:ribosomal protein S18 acetylase RimI-like enzyme
MTNEPPPLAARASALVVRSFEPRDEAALVSLLEEAFPDPAPHNEPRASIRRKLALDRELLLVGHADGRLVATAMGGWDGHRGWLYQVAVARDARGCGHGRAIVRAVEARLRARGCRKLNLQVVASNAAPDFWAQARLFAWKSARLGKLLTRASAESEAQISSRASSSSRVCLRRIRRGRPPSTSTSGA